VRTAPAVAPQFLFDVGPAPRDVVRCVELLNEFAAIGSDDPQFVTTGRERQHLGARILSPALIPPEHARLIGAIQGVGHGRAGLCNRLPILVPSDGRQCRAPKPDGRAGQDVQRVMHPEIHA